MSEEEPQKQLQQQYPFRVRTITAFVSFTGSDFHVPSDGSASSALGLATKIFTAVEMLSTVKKALTTANHDYEVQTMRIATNPFGEWMIDIDSENNNNENNNSNENHPESKKRKLLHTQSIDTKVALDRLNMLVTLLKEHDIQLCAVGPAQSKEELEQLCSKIVQSSPIISCSADLQAADVETAKLAARVIKDIGIGSNASGHGLDNFRFCVTAACCKPFIPFFPAAKSSSHSTINTSNCENNICNIDGVVGFALGLENGSLLLKLLQEAGSIANISTVFKDGMAEALKPLQGKYNTVQYITVRVSE